MEFLLGIFLNGDYFEPFCSARCVDVRQISHNVLPGRTPLAVHAAHDIGVDH